MATWERYIWKQQLKVFFGSLIGFYALYILVDFANQVGAFRSKGIHITWMQWAGYYLYEFIHRAEVLIPFALLLATMRVLLQLNGSLELVALQCGGISLRKILRPFIIWAFVCTLFLYANQEWFIPQSLAQVKFLHAARRQKPVKNQEMTLQSLALLDGSHIVYQRYEPEKNRFFDVHWVRSADSILKMKYFYPYSEVPYGEFAETLQRNDKGVIEHTRSDEFLPLAELTIPKETLQQAAAVPELQRLSTLLQSLPTPGNPMSPREAHSASTFYHKMTMPLLCLIAVILPATFCTRFSRNLPTFLYYAIGIFALIAFYLFLDSLTVLTKRQLFDPAFLLVPPIGVALLYAFWRLLKLR